MDHISGHSPSKVLWSSGPNLGLSCNDDENEVKPVISSLSMTISETIYPHTVHDFSIRIHRRKEYTAPVSKVSLEARPNSHDSGFNPPRQHQKCGDSYVAQTCCGAKRWTSEEVAKVITIERAFLRKSTVVIKFPDKKLNKQVVTKMHKSIRAVNFLQSPYARRCCVTLKDSANSGDVLTTLNSTRFGSGFLSADGNFEELIPASNDIDPFTLFLDNISLDMKKQDLTKIFPNSQQITVGYTNKIYYTKRYAFIIYLTVNDAITAFNRANKEFDVIVRFRRFSGSARLPPESEIKKCQDSQTNAERLLRPILTDYGPPNSTTEETYAVSSVTVKTEPTKRSAEILIDDDDDVDIATNSLSTDFDQFFENLKRARLQMSILREME